MLKLFFNTHLKEIYVGKINKVTCFQILLGFFLLGRLILVPPSYRVVMTMPVVNKNVYNNNIRYEICTITINSYSNTIIMIITVGHSARTRRFF